MRKNHDGQIAQLVGNLPKPPKRTKEQKIIQKAMECIRNGAHEDDAALRCGYINYAMGLLESMLFVDDKEE